MRGTDPSTDPTEPTGTPLTTTPAEDAFRMPAEWEPHVGCLMQFPPPTNYCFGPNQNCNYIESARVEWAAVANAVAEFEPVLMYATPEDASLARSMVGSGVTVIAAPLSDGWSRDTGPLFLKNDAGLVRAACFDFNGWGFSTEYADDALIKWRMVSDLGVDFYDVDMVLEGGAVILDGQGTLITTEQCLLHPTRNPNMTKAEQEVLLKQVFGVHTVIWLDKGWVPDPLTNGHVDGICAFVEPGGLIVPIEGSNYDDAPLQILRNAHPNHTVVGVPCNTLGRAGGGIHCITQQVPVGAPWL